MAQPVEKLLRALFGTRFGGRIRHFDSVSALFLNSLGPPIGPTTTFSTGWALPRINPPAAYEGSSPSFRLVRSTPMTATKNNVPPNSTLVMTVLVLRTSTSRKPCTLRSPPICFLSTHRVHPRVVLLPRITLLRGWVNRVRNKQKPRALLPPQRRSHSRRAQRGFRGRVRAEGLYFHRWEGYSRPARWRMAAQKSRR